jgi:hypothetical protein
MGKDVLYDTLNREDLNWRKHHEQVARKALSSYQAKDSAFVVDDTVGTTVWPQDAGHIKPF